MAPEARGAAVTLFACMLFFGQSLGVLLVGLEPGQPVRWPFTALPPPRSGVLGARCSLVSRRVNGRPSAGLKRCG